MLPAQKVYAGKSFDPQPHRQIIDEGIAQGEREGTSGHSLGGINGTSGAVTAPILSPISGGSFSPGGD